ncbi:ABC transporter permease [Agaricicola taiwanensis]|uniref:ABC transporter permease n=1 Tax=Agaricicola taiwanensis TaxID=591372 RepID=A0A8J2YGS7_9RHOB|nr:ABC transporter permease [Agaricicola taiwanensis]GGE41044.1 ABC transporter permease [Agaricicola taiwanensis]
MASSVMRWLERSTTAVAVGLILAFLIVPTLLVIPMSVSPTSYLRFPPTGISFHWYSAYFSDQEWIAATLFSLKIAGLTTVASTIVGVMAAVALVRGRVPGRETIQALILAPLIVPHIVVAIALYLQFAPLRLVGTTTGFVLAHTVLAVPYVVLIVSAALTRLDQSLEMAALNLGASPLRAFLEITVPLTAPAIAAGAVFAFLASFDETVVSFFLSGVENKTLTRKLFEDIDFNLSPIIAAISTIIVVMTIAIMGLGQLARRATIRKTGTN